MAAPRLLRAQDLPIEVEQETLQRQYNALQAMRLDSVEYSRLGSVKRIAGDTGVVLPPRARNLKAGDSGSDVLQLFKDVLLAGSTESLRVIRHDEVGFNPNPSIRSLRLSQEIRGIPVINSFVGINYDDATRRMSKFVARFIPDRGLDQVPKISAKRAERLIPGVIVAETYLACYYGPDVPTPPRLVWVVRAQDAGAMHWAYYVNAITGLLIERGPVTQTYD